MKKLIDQATDPEQYSSGRAVTWISDDARQQKQQESFWNAIKPFIKIPCKSALDIGCGSGWSEKKFSELGSDWTGLEPSSGHFQNAKEANPGSKIFNTTFDGFNEVGSYDCVIAIMVFSHIKEVSDAFRKIHSLLNAGGVFIMINSTFHEGKERLERNGRTYAVEVIDDDQYVDKAIVGAYGIADINRRSEYYIAQAGECGLSLFKHATIADEGYSPKELLVFHKA